MILRVRKLKFSPSCERLASRSGRLATCGGGGGLCVRQCVGADFLRPVFFCRTSFASTGRLFVVAVYVALRFVVIPSFESVGSVES